MRKWKWPQNYYNFWVLHHCWLIWLWSHSVGEDQCIIRDRQSVESGATIEGVQICFCMDIQISEKDSTKAGTTQNWVGYYYTTDTLG